MYSVEFLQAILSAKLNHRRRARPRVQSQIASAIVILAYSEETLRAGCDSHKSPKYVTYRYRPLQSVEPENIAIGARCVITRRIFDRFFLLLFRYIFFTLHVSISNKIAKFIFRKRFSIPSNCEKDNSY